MKNIKVLMFSTLLLACQIAMGQGVTLSVNGSPNSRTAEIFRINSAVTEDVDVGLRLQVHQNGTFYDRMIWNQIGTGALNFSLWQSTSNSKNNAEENAIGDTDVKLNDDGQLIVSQTLTVGTSSHVAGSALTIGGVTHLAPSTATTTNHATHVDFLDSFLLYVEEGIVSNAFSIAAPTDWADYVFKADYELQPLEQVEDFIEKEGHLPGVPSRAEVQEKGYSVHKMNTLLLEKIEELTLHIIEQRHKLNAMTAELTNDNK